MAPKAPPTFDKSYSCCFKYNLCHCCILWEYAIYIRLFRHLNLGQPVAKRVRITQDEPVRSWRGMDLEQRYTLCCNTDKRLVAHEHHIGQKSYTVAVCGIPITVVLTSCLFYVGKADSQVASDLGITVNKKLGCNVAWVSLQNDDWESVKLVLPHQINSITYMICAE